MTTYALIHGAHHGAWCWDFVAPELATRGHHTVAVDLPIEDPAAGVSDYAATMVDALADVDDDVVVVGHSLGGLTVPVVAAQRPVRRVVYIAAPIPVPGQPFAEQRRHEPEMAPNSIRIDNGDGTWVRPADEATRLYYHDCTETQRQYALARLRRQSTTPHQEPSPIDAMPDVPATYLLTTDDRAVHPGWQRWAAHTHLGVDPIELPGSHSPFIARPVLLADVLSRLS